MANIKIFKDKENVKTLDEVQKDAVESTSFNFNTLNVVAKIRFHVERFDPTDGFYAELFGGLGVKILAELEQKMNKQYDETTFTFSDSDKMLGIELFNAFMGLEVGFQRFGIFYRQHFTPVFTSKKIDEKKICSFPFCAGLAVNLL